ncbi:MAG: transglutaminase domain-containing protein, partial [Micromonosporaceae bacterium]|nr:transglutaminase domain-containing protein [Micromonosporaceae bacterium]
GWVAFNPLPRPDTKPKPVENDFRPTPEPTPPSPSSMPTPSTSTMSPAGPATAAGPPPAGTGGGWPWHAITATVAAVLLPLAYLLIPWRIRARRRRRLWQGDPASRVLGAWYEINDLLRLAGRPAPPSLAATEVSAFAARATAGPSHGLRPAAAPTAPEFLTDLAALVNRVVFAPIGVTADEAGRAVALAVGYRTELLSRRSRRQRWLWALDPRPLLWQRQIRLDRAAR